MSETLDISTARARLNKLDCALVEHPVILITRHGRPVFAVVDSDYLEGLTETVAILADPNAMPMLARSTDDIKHGRLFSQEEVEQELAR